MKSQYKKGVLTFSLTLLFLAGCSDSGMVDEFEKSRNYFNDRTGTEAHATDTDTKSLAKWYSWQNNPDTQELEAPNGTKLIEAKVLNVVDGDTIDVKITNGKEERVRLILVNAPESKGDYEKKPQPYALVAQDFTKSLLLNNIVWLQKGIEERDKYGRLLAYVWLDNVVLNEEVEEEKETIIIGKKIGLVTINELLLKEGLAHVSVFPPNTEYVDEFEAIQKQVEAEKKGIWSQ